MANCSLFPPISHPAVPPPSAPHQCESCKGEERKGRHRKVLAQLLILNWIPALCWVPVTAAPRTQSFSFAGLVGLLASISGGPCPFPLYHLWPSIIHSTHRLSSLPCCSPAAPWWFSQDLEQLPADSLSPITHI